MANVAVDWTVDKLLSGLATLNTQTEQTRAKVRNNRTAYLDTLRSLPSIRDVAARERIRAELGRWIPTQVDVENRFNGFLANYTAAKTRVKSFLQSMGVTPPLSLGALPLVPIAIYGGIALLLITGGAIWASAVARGKGLAIIQDIARTARENNWSAADTAAALEAAARAGDATDPGPPDPYGFSNLLEKALPVIALIGAIVLFGPMLKRKSA